MRERRRPNRLVHGRGDLAALDPLHPLRARVPRRRRVDHAAAADRRAGAQDDAVASRGDDGLREAELRPALAHAHDAAEHLRGAVVDVDAGRDLGELLEHDVEAVADGVRARRHERVAAAQLAALDAGQGDRDALARLGALDRPVVHLDAAHANAAAARLRAQLVPFADRPGPERAGGDGADAAQREDAVDVEARRRVAALGLDRGGGRGERSAQLVEPERRCGR